MESCTLITWEGINSKTGYSPISNQYRQIHAPVVPLGVMVATKLGPIEILPNRYFISDSALLEFIENGLMDAEEVNIPNKN